MRTFAVAVLMVVLNLGHAVVADAQYFGRNKVQYEHFDFKVLKTDHFDIYYYPEEEAAVTLASRMAERWYARLSQLLRHELTGRQPLILYAAHPHFEQTVVLPGEIGEGTGGVTESLKRRIVLPFAGGLAETDHVLGHELVHAFQYDLAAQRDAQGRPVGAAILAAPLWFIEGMAEYLSLGPVDAHTAMWIRDASLREAMPDIDDLDDPDYFPYRYGHAFWAYVAGRWGDAVVGDILRTIGSTGGEVTATLERLLQVDVETLSRDWHLAARETYAPYVAASRPPSAFARSLVTRERGGGDLNIAPAVSPDGRRVVFLSERSMFSIDMYLADVATGQVIRRLVSTATDPHFDSLQFLQSAGDWAPDNRRFVFAAVSKGQPVLAVLDADTGRTEREVEFPDLDEIFNPVWSPDGTRVAFSAQRGGVLDLFVYRLDDGMLTPLTNDPFADSDPEWARDGRTLAFVTDRFSSDLDALRFGNYRIGAIDVASRDIRPLAGFDTGYNTNPEWSADGQLFFVANPDGIANLYRADARGAVTQLTHLQTGVSGITPLTPALSVAASGGAYVFSVFEAGKYNLYTGDAAAAAPAQGLASSPDRGGDVLPPRTRTASSVASLLQSPSEGLPAPRTLERSDYQARLSLDGVSQPTVGIGMDRFGAYAGGGLSLSFSDMLGYHTLVTAAQLTSRFEEFGGVVGYLNRRSRWAWGVIADQTPYVTGDFARSLATVNGQTVVVDETLRVTQVNRGASGIIQYPFSRSQRLEFTGGARRISFDRELQTEIFSPQTGELLDEQSEDLSRPDSLTFAEGSAALVFDSSVFGATSPILGQRYRFELSQVAGSLSYSGVLGDFRRYFMPARPFTIAVRALHYGRYGRDGEDLRLSPLYLGDSGLVRGYEIPSFDPDECPFIGGCPSFDQLLGSRIALVGAELRFPLVGVFSRRTFYGPLPIEVALFGDAGVAWTSDSSPSLFGGTREGVRSAGVALRANIFGFAVAEVDYVRPIDRPERGWVWQFNLIPGF